MNFSTEIVIDARDFRALFSACHKFRCCEITFPKKIEKQLQTTWLDGKYPTIDRMFIPNSVDEMKRE